MRARREPMRRSSLVLLLVAAGSLAATRAFGDEWTPPESGEVREKAVSELVLALERAKEAGYSIGPLSTRVLWFGPYGCSKDMMDEETTAAVRSTGVSPEELAWTGERVLEVMRLACLVRTPIAELKKREQELSAELVRRGDAVK